MNTRQVTRPATLLAATLLLALPTLAAPHIDPKLVGHWTAGVPVKPGGPPPINFTITPDGISTQEIHGRGVNLSLKSTCTTKSGLLTETFIRATSNGKPLASSPPAIYLYRIVGTSLTLSDIRRPWHMTLHRAKS